MFILISCTISPELFSASDGREEITFCMCLVAHLSMLAFSSHDSVVQESAFCLAFSIGSAVRKAVRVIQSCFLDIMQLSKSVKTGVVTLPHQLVRDDYNHERDSYLNQIGCLLCNFSLSCENTVRIIYASFITKKFYS